MDMMPRAQHAQVWSKEGQALQRADRLKPWDHWPAVATFALLQARDDAKSKRDGGVRLDQDALRNCLISGENRQQVLDDIDALLTLHSPAIEHAFEKAPTPDELHDVLINVSHQITDKHFKAANKDPNTQSASKVWAQTTSKLLKRRAELKWRISDIDDGPLLMEDKLIELADIQWELIRI